VQKEGHLPICFLLAFVIMADSELSGSEAAKVERPTWVRTLLWAAVGIALIVGLVLFFRYTRHITPLL
jgi:hypothetical protein